MKVGRLIELLLESLGEGELDDECEFCIFNSPDLVLTGDTLAMNIIQKKVWIGVKEHVS